MFGGLGIWELIFIFLVVLLLFGAKRLPEIGASLGKGIREFKGSLSEIEKEIKAPGGESPPRDRDAVESTDEASGPRRLRSDSGPASVPSRPAPEKETVGGEGRTEEGGTEV